MTYDELCELEPELISLLERAKVSKSDDPVARFCGYGKHFGRGFKRHVTRLVGWDRKTGLETLQSIEAYELVYETILSAVEDASR